jgi:hypothetical protein
MVLGTYSSLFQSPYSYSTTLGPLLVLMSLSILKEGLGDLERHRADRDVDRTPVEILSRRGAALLMDIRPGDVVKVKRGEVRDPPDFFRGAPCGGRASGHGRRGEPSP